VLLAAFFACASSSPLPVVAANPASEVVATPAEPAPRDPTEPRYAATVVLVTWKGAVNAPSDIERTQPEAFALALAIRDRARRGEDLGAIAAAESDALAGRSGALGTWATGTMDPGLERAVAAVEVGAIAPIAETPQGWWVARREAVDVRRFGEILVRFQGTWRSGPERTRAEAIVRAEEALRRIDAGEPFSQVAGALSDAGAAGADLGLVGHDQLIPAVEAAGWPLAVGEHTAVVESPYGLHVLIRLE
jgi:hypothetical protein